MPDGDGDGLLDRLNQRVASARRSAQRSKAERQRERQQAAESARESVETARDTIDEAGQLFRALPGGALAADGAAAAARASDKTAETFLGPPRGNDVDGDGEDEALFPVFAAEGQEFVDADGDGDADFGFVGVGDGGRARDAPDPALAPFGRPDQSARGGRASRRSSRAAAGDDLLNATEEAISDGRVDINVTVNPLPSDGDPPFEPDRGESALNPFGALEDGR
jgi:hypothetical protein